MIEPRETNEFTASASRREDACLAERVANGDHESMKAIFDSHFDAVFSLCVSICGQPADAEEVSSAVFIEFWESPNRYHPLRGSLRTYLCVLARSRSIDRLRQLRTREERQQTAMLSLNGAAREMEVDSDPAGKAASNDEKESIWSAIESLPHEFSEVLKLSFRESLTHREIASALQLPLGTVKCRIRRGLTAFSERLKSTLARSAGDADEL